MPQWAKLPIESLTVERSRSALQKGTKFLAQVRKVTLRHLSFGLRSSYRDFFFKWYLEKRVHPWLTKWYGHVRYDTMSPPQDPVSKYLAVLLADGDCYEGVRYDDTPNRMFAYYNGQILASFVERPSDVKECKIFGFRLGEEKVGLRIWSILGADGSEVGAFAVQRPVTPDSKCLVRLLGERDLRLDVVRTEDSSCLPFEWPRILRAIRNRRMPRVWHGDRVLPSGYHTPLTAIAARLHFVLSIAIRLFYRRLNYPAGDGEMTTIPEDDW